MAHLKIKPLPDTRKTILFWTMLAIVMCGLFPPWSYTFYMTGGAGFRSEKDAGYYFILNPPPPEYNPSTSHFSKEGYGVKLDAQRLLVEWVCILAVGGAAWGVARLNRERISEANQKPQGGGV